MTLIELLVVMTIIGLVVTVIAGAIVVVLRQAPETEARISTARWEQNLGTWLPADLASAEWPVDANGNPVPDTDPRSIQYPDHAPCGSAACTFGDNIAHFTWDDGGQVDVSYRYGQVSPPDGGWELRRVECRAATCDSITLVREMPAPSSDGDPPVSVTFPPDVLEVDPSGNEIVNSTGRRVTVSVSGPNGPDLLTFAGGGIERIDLQPAAIQPPEFLRARSGCGGPISLIVDESGSLSSSDAVEIKTGVKSFVAAFAGTPTQLQIIGFNERARVLDEVPGDAAAEPWNYWFDLSEQSVVELLLGGSSPIDDLRNTNSTNWEDALYRAFYTETGLTYEAASNPATPPAELVVFFTDGLPTDDRDANAQTGAEAPEAPSVPARFDAGYRSSVLRFGPRAWYRAQWLRQQTSTRLIGVGVGNAFGGLIRLQRDTALTADVIASDWSAPYVDGDRTLGAEVALGDLVAGNDLSNYSGTTSDRYVKVEFDGGWDPDDVENADILTTNDFSQFGGALESIALAECGGTLTVQTRMALPDGTPVKAPVTYEASGDDAPLTESTTSAVSKTAVFNIATGGGTTSDVLLRPRSLDSTGFAAKEWVCRRRNVAITDPAELSLADPDAGPLAGINITVAAEEAVSCILFVE